MNYEKLNKRDKVKNNLKYLGERSTSRRMNTQPATEPQKDLLEQLGVQYPETLTLEQARTLITIYKQPMPSSTYSDEDWN